LKRHILRHHQDKALANILCPSEPPQCNGCGRLFTKYGNLQRHKKLCKEVPYGHETPSTRNLPPIVSPPPLKQSSKLAQALETSLESTTIPREQEEAKDEASASTTAADEQTDAPSTPTMPVEPPQLQQPDCQFATDSGHEELTTCRAKTPFAQEHSEPLQLQYYSTPVIPVYYWNTIPYVLTPWMIVPSPVPLPDGQLQQPASSADTDTVMVDNDNGYFGFQPEIVW
jgi:hypothetical protein